MILKDSLTVLILPFSFKDKQVSIHVDSIWEKSYITMEDSYFFPHVTDYLKQAGTTLIYDLKDSFKNIGVEKEIASIFKKTHFVEDKTSKRFFKFGMQKNTLNSPKLWLFPLASVGFLTFTIQISGDEATIEDLMNLNYCLAKYSKSQISDINIVINNEKEISFNEAAVRALAMYGQTSKRENAWNLSQLSEFLLKDIIDDVEPNHTHRFHLFTYCQIDSSKEKEYDVKRDFLRIVRVQNSNYNPITEEKNTIKQTFDEIFIGSSVESGGMLLDLNGRTNQVLVNFKTHTLLSRYLWIYLIVYHQRILLINRVGKISRMDITNTETSKDEMFATITELSKISVKTSFSDISDFTQINTYYEFLSNSLKINNYINDLKLKTQDIQAILQEKTDKEEKQRAIAEKKRASQIEVVLTLLLFPQILFAFMSFLNDYLGIKSAFSFFQFFENKKVAAFISLIVFIVTAGCLIVLLSLLVKNLENTALINIKSFFSTKIKRHWKWTKDS